MLMLSGNMTIYVTLYNHCGVYMGLSMDKAVACRKSWCCQDLIEERDIGCMVDVGSMLGTLRTVEDFLDVHSTGKWLCLVYTDWLSGYIWEKPKKISVLQLIRLEVEHWQESGKSLKSNGIKRYKTYRCSSQVSTDPLIFHGVTVVTAEVWGLRRSSCEGVSRGERMQWFQRHMAGWHRWALRVQIF